MRGRRRRRRRHLEELPVGVEEVGDGGHGEVARGVVVLAEGARHHPVPGGGGGGIGGGGCSKNTLESIKATLPESRPSPPTRQCCIIIFNMHRP